MTTQESPKAEPPRMCECCSKLPADRKVFRAKRGYDDVVGAEYNWACSSPGMSERIRARRLAITAARQSAEGEPKT